MSDIPAVKRQLKIKSGVVQRLAKETKLYRKETGQLETKLEKLVADAADEWDVKNARKMVDESNKMILDCTTRLGKAVEDLQALIKSAKEETGLAATDEDLVKAEQTIQETA
ncbi:hypothetical protein GALMADRAFT_234632 [Galerina marginata CBS 339.88]|uniref:Tubulin-specific chaperone A n=1 Tax=Galerina marginata (strain CBS 339.88) TaxID=685588 RepID=A0A067TR01_GALM3|nr:hypothetical protein GALMADRAFT_234632 [Galerina marginata CBS 339.88]